MSCIMQVGRNESAVMGTHREQNQLSDFWRYDNQKIIIPDFFKFCPLEPFVRFLEELSFNDKNYVLSKTDNPSYKETLRKLYKAHMSKDINTLSKFFDHKPRYVEPVPNSEMLLNTRTC